MAILPDDPRLSPLWTNLTFAIPEIKSTPSGAEVLVKGYDVADDAWISLGRTPLRDVCFPRGTARLRIVKDGFAPYDGTPTIFATDVVLDAAGAVPDGMVRVPAGTGSNEGRTFPVPAFWMDRFEVTNRQFKAFVDAGGYSNRAYWQVPVVENGRELSWEVAIARFRDRTGRPGPSTWELGSFPQGQADFPVSGVSWYEAAAYAAFAGKALPTAFQWRRGRRFQRPERRVRRHPACTATSAARARWPSARSRASDRSDNPTGRQRQGVVLERIAERADDPRRRVERAEIHVRGSRRAATARPARDLRIPAGEERRPATRGVLRLRPAAGARLHRRETDRRCGVQGGRQRVSPTTPGR